MSVYVGQVNVGTGGTVLAQLPPGPASVTISNAGPSPIYIGTGATVAAAPGTATQAAAGMPVPSGGIFTFELFQGSPGTTLRAIAPGTASTAGFLISTAYGLPQPGTQ